MLDVKSLDKEHLLNMLGLETRRTTSDYVMPALAIFGVGILVGAGVGLLFAPRPGRELREDLYSRIQHAPDAIARLPQKAAELLPREAADAVPQRDRANRPAEKQTGIS